MKKLTYLILAVLMTGIFVLTSCTSVRDQVPVQPTATNTTLPTPTTYPGNVSLDVTTARFYDKIKSTLNLTENELKLLKKNGFMVTDRLAWDRFLDAYAWIYAKDLPVLVTTDSILHSVHQSYDNLLMDIERLYIMSELQGFLQKTRVEVSKARQANIDDKLTSLYDDVEIYLMTAAALLNNETPSNETVKKCYNQALQAGEFVDVDLFGSIRKIDFTLFKPRGHYTASPELERYFRSMMWLAQIDFRLVEYDPLTNDPTVHQSQMAAAMILRDAIDKAGARTAWKNIDQILKALVGESDNITLPDFDRLLTDINLNSPAEILRTDANKILDQLAKTDYGQQRITGQLLSRAPGNTSADPIPRPISFMLMGQRFAIDSYAMSNLVYDRMMKDGKPIERALPSTLDVMYTLGNDRALTHLEPELQKYGYQDSLATMRSEVDALPASFWQAPTYNQWLGMLRALNQNNTALTLPSSAPAHYAQTFQTEAWADKILQTQLASWAQLRHDNILYVKQSVTTMIACEYPDGYVEPYPGFYGALESYAQAGLDAVSLITGLQDSSKKRMLEYFQNVISTAKQLKILAEKELMLQEFTAEETQFLKSVVVRQDGERGCGGPNFVWNGWYVKMFYGEDKTPALIADIHTNPDNDGPLAPTRVLHAATGPVAPICLAAETDEGATMYVGPAFTYYDVIETGYPPKRLNDEEWRARLSTSSVEHPDWTQSFLAPSGHLPEMLSLDK